MQTMVHSGDAGSGVKMSHCMRSLLPQPAFAWLHIPCRACQQSLHEQKRFCCAACMSTAVVMPDRVAQSSQSTVDSLRSHVLLSSSGSLYGLFAELINRIC